MQRGLLRSVLLSGLALGLGVSGTLVVGSRGTQASETQHRYEGFVDGWGDGGGHAVETLNCSPGYVAATKNDLR
jgi:hypothetical protein